tara:strand:+ start:736 stop:1383 length:648 start_codon:yes stop_codon:yes gene_type:complete
MSREINFINQNVRHVSKKDIFNYFFNTSRENQERLLEGSIGNIYEDIVSKMLPHTELLPRFNRGADVKTVLQAGSIYNHSSYTCTLLTECKTNFKPREGKYFTTDLTNKDKSTDILINCEDESRGIKATIHLKTSKFFKDVKNKNSDISLDKENKLEFYADLELNVREGKLFSDISYAKGLHKNRIYKNSLYLVNNGCIIEYKDSKRNFVWKAND